MGEWGRGRQEVAPGRDQCGSSCPEGRFVQVPGAAPTPGNQEEAWQRDLGYCPDSCQSDTSSLPPIIRRSLLESTA
jgi:hypothetical protein